MQQLLTTRLVGDVGVNYDLEPCDLPLETFTYGRNFLLRNGKIYSFFGSTLLAKEFTGGYKFAQVMFVSYPPNNYFIVMGNKAVYVYDGSNWTSIGFGLYALMNPGDEYFWTYCSMGAIPVINNPQGYPQYWSPQNISTVLKELPFSLTQTWLAKGYRTNVIRAHKNFLFALGMYEGGTYFPNNYRWSTAADNNGLPYTWDPLDLAAIAGQASILGDTGPIVDGLSMRDSFCIYSTDGITILDPSGDNYIWRARTLSSSIGLLTSNCIASINGVHIFLSRGDIFLNDGNSVRSIVDRRVRSKLRDLASSSYYHRSYCITDERTKEVWFCIPADSSTYPNFAIIYNAVDDTISSRYIDRPLTSMCYGLTTIAVTSWSGTIDPYTTWNVAPNTWTKTPGQWGNGIQSTVTWATKKGNWNSDTTSPFSYQVIGINATDDGLYDLTRNDGSSGDHTTLERVGAVFGDQRAVTSIIRAYPHMEGSSPVVIQMGSQEFVGGGTNWSPLVEFTPDTDRKVDIRTTGKLHGWRISSTDEVQFSFSGMDIEYANNGVR